MAHGQAAYLWCGVVMGGPVDGMDGMDGVDEMLAQARQLSAAAQVQLMRRLFDVLAGGLAEASEFHPRPSPRQAGQAPAAVQDLEAITYQIIGCAMQVHRTQGPGLREDSYQRDLETHFTHAGLLYTAQKVLEVYDSLQGGKLIGYYIPDFVVADQVVVEIKSLSHLDDSHLAQVIGYLAVTGCKVGLLINFGKRSLQWRRILPPKDVAHHQANRQWLYVPGWLNA